MKELWRKLKPIRVRLALLLSIIGPGLITASADNDAAGIATYSLVGSTFGYQMLWVILLITFGEVIVQEMAARMGAVTNKGMADLIRENFKIKITVVVMIFLLIANLGTTIAQLAGIAAVSEMFGLNRLIVVPMGAALVIYLVLKGTYEKVEKVLILLSMFALCYVITGFVIKPDWGEIAGGLLVPSFQNNRMFMITLLATIGTTITPWGMVYMQASIAEKATTLENYKLTKMDVTIGASWGNVVSTFIIICTAGLFIKGIQVETAEQAAMALEPLVGKWASLVFSFGLIGASLLAAVVLPLCTSYAICEAFGWERGVNQSFKQAPIFHLIFIGMVVFSGLVVMIPSLPLFQVMWISQTANALLMPFLLVLVLILINKKGIMKRWVNTRLQNTMVVALTLVIVVVTCLMFIYQ